MSSPKRVRLQNVIPKSNIVIDKWDMKLSKESDPRIRFMTSIKHHSVKSMSHLRKAKYSIRTSLFNKWYLHQFYGISENRIIVLDINKTVEIYDWHRNEKFCVTAIEANYCSGSIMFLFQGPFGNILYTGYFRTSSAAQIYHSPALKQLIVEKSVHVAYIDNSYAAEHCTFPTRHETIQKIIQFIRCSENCDIIISTNPLGKEEVLLAIASELNEKIHVGSQRYEIFNKLGVSDFFTRNTDGARIRALDELLSLKECYQRFEENESCVIILLTALYAFEPKKFPIKRELPRLHIIPYSGHCNHLELKQFVYSLRPHSIFPIVKSRSQRLCSVIPQSIFDLCYKKGDVRDRDETKFFEPIDEKYLPIVLIPRLLESPKTRSRALESEFTSSAENSLAEAKRIEQSVTAVSAAEIANEECPKGSSETCENSFYSPQRISTKVKVPTEVVATENESYAVQGECRAISPIDKNIEECTMAEETKLEQNPQTVELLGGAEVSSVEEYLTAVDVPNTFDVGTSDLTSVRSPLENIVKREEEKSCDMLTDFTRPNTDENMDCASDEMQPFSMVESDDSNRNNDQLIDEYIIEQEVPDSDDADKCVVTAPHSQHGNEASEDASSERSSGENAKRMDSVEMKINLNEVDRVEGTKNAEQIPRTENHPSALESGLRSSDSPTKSIELLPLQRQDVQFEGEEMNSRTAPKSSSNRIFPPGEQETITVTLTVDANRINPRSASTTPSSENGVDIVCSDVSATLFESDEHCSKNLCPLDDIGSRMVESSAPVVQSVSVVLSDSCEIIELDSFPNNFGPALERSRTDCDGRYDEDGAELSDPSDCVIVGEYFSKVGSDECDRRVSKKLRLDSTQRNDVRNNDRFVNAILFHYCKLYDAGKSMVASNQWDFLSGCNIFSHSAYRR